MEEFSLTQEEVARTLGRSRSALANKLRLLELPDEVRQAVMENRLSEGHARALLGLEDKGTQSELGGRIWREKLTVREVEQIVAGAQPVEKNGAARAAKRKDPDVRRLEEDLQRTLGRRVLIEARRKNKGWLRLEFYSIDDLQRLLNDLKKNNSHKK